MDMFSRPWKALNMGWNDQVPWKSLKFHSAWASLLALIEQEKPAYTENKTPDIPSVTSSLLLHLSRSSVLSSQGCTFSNIWHSSILICPQGLQLASSCLSWLLPSRSSLTRQQASFTPPQILLSFHPGSKMSLLTRTTPIVLPARPSWLFRVSCVWCDSLHLQHS